MTRPSAPETRGRGESSSLFEVLAPCAGTKRYRDRLVRWIPSARTSRWSAALAYSRGDRQRPKALEAFDGK